MSTEAADSAATTAEAETEEIDSKESHHGYGPTVVVDLGSGALDDAEVKLAFGGDSTDAIAEDAEVEPAADGAGDTVREILDESMAEAERLIGADEDEAENGKGKGKSESESSATGTREAGELGSGGLSAAEKEEKDSEMQMELAKFTKTVEKKHKAEAAMAGGSSMGSSGGSGIALTTISEHKDDGKRDSGTGKAKTPDSHLRDDSFAKQQSFDLDEEEESHHEVHVVVLCACACCVVLFIAFACMISLSYILVCVMWIG